MNQTANPNNVQYGGDHYMNAGKAQHWDMITVFGYGWEYYIARATAYLTRVKQPELDPKKAGHFVEKLIWLIDSGVVRPTYGERMVRTVAELNHYLTDVYFPANNIRLTSNEAQAITALMFARNRSDLMAARAIINAIDINANQDRTFVFGDDAIAACSRDEK